MLLELLLQKTSPIPQNSQSPSCSAHFSFSCSSDSQLSYPSATYKIPRPTLLSPPSSTAHAGRSLQKYLFLQAWHLQQISPALISHPSQPVSLPSQDGPHHSVFTLPPNLLPRPVKGHSWALAPSTALYWHLLQGGSCFGYHQIQGESDFSLTQTPTLMLTDFLASSKYLPGTNKARREKLTPS